MQSPYCSFFVIFFFFDLFSWLLTLAVGICYLLFRHIAITSSNDSALVYIYDSQIVHHNPCFNLFILHSDPFDNQGSEINKNDIFLCFNILSFTKRYICVCVFVCLFVCLFVCPLEIYHDLLMNPSDCISFQTFSIIYQLMSGLQKLPSQRFATYLYVIDNLCW